MKDRTTDSSTALDKLPEHKPHVPTEAEKVDKGHHVDESASSTSKKQTVMQHHGYNLGRQIGNGSYATVKLAFSEKHQSNVAVKIVSKSQAPKDYIKKFLPRELDVVKGLKHKNLIRFLQAIETTHRVYIIMEYAENGSLLDIIRRERHINEDRSRKWFKQLAEAVSYCHDHGIVHRDIKCENLLMDRNYNIKLSDFGFARREPDRKGALSDTYCGSYAYASPEILRGIPYHPKLSDIWSMGVVLYAMVYGSLPFDDTNFSILLKQVQNKIHFPKEPPVSNLCKSLITRILAPLRLRLRMPAILNDLWVKEKTEKDSSVTTPEQPLSKDDESSSEGITSDSEAVPVKLITKEELKAVASPRKPKLNDENESTDEGGTTEDEEGIRIIKGRDTDSEDGN